jgi:hypothetical protein
VSVQTISVWRFFQLFGVACLAVVVLTHVAEKLHILSIMGWGLPDSPGHYIDLVSAILGCTLLPIGFVGMLIVHRCRGCGTRDRGH